jgi:hypothetical protein
VSDTNENGPRLTSRPVGAVSEETSLLHAEKYTLPQGDQEGGAAVSDNITLPREVVERLVASWGRDTKAFIDSMDTLRAALAAPRPEPVLAQHRFRHPKKGSQNWGKWHECDVRNRPACEIDSQGYEVEYRPLYTTPPAAAPRPEPESKTPAWWMDGLTATLMREGVNKHRAREIAVGYWEAYCQIPGTEEDKT